MLNLKEYLLTYNNLIFSNDACYKLEILSKKLLIHRENSKRLLIFGNGASSSISSHAALDFTKQGKLTSLCFHDPSLLTAFSNDYGYENVKEYLNLETDKLIKKENFDRYEFDSIVEWWRKKASNRFETLKQDGRLRTDIEVWNRKTDIDIIR